MGNPFAKKRIAEAIVEDFQLLIDENEGLVVRSQLTAICVMMSIILMIRYAQSSRIQALHGEKVLDVHALNRVVAYKEVFVAYLSAAILEPVLAISGTEEMTKHDIFVDIMTLGSICWWIWLVADAFDYTDVMQQFKYNMEFREEMESDTSKKYDWLRLRSVKEVALAEKQSLAGDIRKDASLWFLLACIVSAWMPGIVGHRDVLHAYVIVFLWIILHHNCRQATTWGSSYISSFLFPSVAIMPLEYCLPLMDTGDVVEDLDFVVTYREFLARRTGVQLVIES